MLIVADITSNAVAAASAFTDRLCIATNGTFNGHLSTQDVLTCSQSAGCNGGNDQLAWLYFWDTGICTGGDYNSQEGCQPYTPPPCEHHVHGPRKNCSLYPEPYPSPECQTSCYNKKYKKHTKDQDLHKVKSAYTIDTVNLKKVQKEIYEHGPVTAGFVVCEDFVSYKSGVYSNSTCIGRPNHAVKVIGWGTENKTDYWLVANSWNSDWGDKGFFKIRRGTNMCRFEEEFSFGYPAV